jgi:hypothetical protein
MAITVIDMFIQEKKNMGKTDFELRRRFLRFCQVHHLLEQEIRVTARTLKPDEAIGHPESDDFPLQKGRERLMQARFETGRGQAFTDQYGDFKGRLKEVVRMDFANNYRRAVFVATLNAVLAHFGEATGTVHCRDQEPTACAEEVSRYIRARYGVVRLTQIGFQPRLVDRLQQDHEYRVVDLDPDNIGESVGAAQIEGPEATADAVAWADLLLVTGTTLVNDTVDAFLDRKPIIFYGTTIAGAARMMKWERVCPCSH